MAKFHFFTDIDLLQAQTQAQAFGVGVGTTAIDEFQLTSVHSATADSKAYAVCDGIAFIQQSTNATLVNIIVKPLQQPPFAFPKVKFYIYRGIKIDSLISGNDIGLETLNDLTKSIWTSQKALDKSQKKTTATTPTVEALGYDLSTSADTGSIDDIFHRVGVNFQLPVIKNGWHIGTFDSASFGFEIMVESIGFDPTLAIARKEVNTVQVNKLSTTPTQAEEFEHWHDKEDILNYIDPCAFFGSFYLYKLVVLSSTGSDRVKKEDLYDKVLKGSFTATTDGIFFNRNSIYIDIRNEFNFSFNYFKNYGTEINTAFEDSASLATKDYYANGWPILVIQNSDLPTTNTTDTPNLVRLAMPDGNGDNPLPMLYVSAGYLQENYPREPQDKGKMIDLTVTDGVTDEVKLVFPNRKGQTTTTAVSCYIKLKYFKRFDPNAATPPVSSGTVIRASNYLDCIFAPFEMKIPFAGVANLKTIVYDEEIFIDTQKESNIDFIAKVGMSDDAINYVFFAYPDILRKEEKSVSELLLLTSESNNLITDFYSFVTSKNKNIEVTKSYLELPTDPDGIDYIEFKNTTEVENFKNSSTDNLVCVGLCKSDLANVDITAFNTKYKIYLGVTNELNDVDEIGQYYTSYNITLIGFELNSGVLNVKNVITTLKIYCYGESL